jgi:multiple sugar transport system permease protein
MTSTTLAPSGRGSRTPTQRLLGKHPIGWLFAGPYLIFWLALFAYPLGFAIYMSFFDYFFAAPGARVSRPFVGLDNYTALLSDASFRRAVLNIFVVLIINVPLTATVALVLATALNTSIPGRTFFRVGYYVPYVTSSVAVIAVWLFLLQGGGLLSNLLGPLFPEPPPLINELWAMPIIALFVTWKQLGFYVLAYLAALQNIPKELYEAASVDGAGTIRKFLSVTVPGVRPATTLVVILATITGANLFTEPYLLTQGGGPNGASVSPVFLMYREGIEQGHPGYAAAMGVTLAIAVMGLSLLNRYLLERD